MIFGKSVKTILVNRDDSKASMADGKNVKTIPAILRVNAMTRETLICTMKCKYTFIADAVN